MQQAGPLLIGKRNVLKSPLETIAYSIVTLYHLCKQFGIPKCTGRNEPVLIVRPDDGPIGPKHVALNVLLMVIIRCVRLKINILCMKYGTHQYK